MKTIQNSFTNKTMKHFSKTIAFTLTILLSSSLRAQNTTNSIQLQLGLSSSARQDLIFSPFIHNDLSPINVGIRYQKEKTFYQNLHVRFSSLKPSLIESYEFYDNNEINQLSPHIFFIVDLDYWLGKELRRSEQSATRVGMALNADIQALNYSYGRFSSFGYYSALGLGGFISHTHNINERNKITGQIALPLFSWLARSPYLLNDDEYIENISSRSGLKTFLAFISDGNFATLNKLQTLDFRVNYTYKLTDRWEFGCDYLFEFIHSKEPRNLLSCRNSIFLNTTLKF
jgi:hypothetical protein